MCSYNLKEYTGHCLLNDVLNFNFIKCNYTWHPPKMFKSQGYIFMGFSGNSFATPNVVIY